MNILLFSTDEKLACSCRETLVEVFGVESTLEIGRPGQLPAREELCLWDFIPEETAIPQDFDRRTTTSASLDRSPDSRVQEVRTPNAFRVDIRDSGPGIPEAHLVKIFEEYTSCSGGQDRSGGGLGSAICRMILQRHLGQVWAESHTDGAVFSFVLPVQPIDIRVPAGQKIPAKACLAGVEGKVTSDACC